MSFSPEIICFLFMLIPSVLVPLFFQKRDKDLFLRFRAGVYRVFSCEQSPPSSEEVERIKGSFNEERERMSYSIFARVFVMFCISLPFIMSFYNFQMSIICGSASCETIAEYRDYAIISTFIVSCCFFTLLIIGLIPSIKRLFLINSMIDSYFLESNDSDWVWMNGCEEILNYQGMIKKTGRKPIELELYVASEKYHKIKNKFN